VTIDTPERRYGPLTLALRRRSQMGNAVVAAPAPRVGRRGGVAVAAAHIEPA
jgi:hypothetical protein